MKIYKLTDENGRTRGNTQWGEGVTHRATGRGTELCSDGFIHAYEHPLLAVLLNPIHADFANPQLWEAKGRIALRDGQLKCGCKKLTTIRQIPLPEITNEQRVRFAIGCAWQVYDAPAWRSWATGWLTGKDRSERAAAEAAAAAEARAAAAWAALRAAAAARATGWLTGKDRSERAAAWVEAADAAAWAEAATDLDLIVIAEWAMTDKPIEELSVNECGIIPEIKEGK
jgi:hypothetical protein